jgi:broad specificity phosphatase PhoE
MPAPLLYYVRHGETEWNAQGRLQGQHDSDLTASGRVQAVRCGEILRDLVARNGRELIDFDYVASPLGRARATMERMRAALGLAAHDYRTDARLKEMSFGSWEGIAYPELRTRAQAVLAARERDKWNFKPPGGESYAELLIRVSAWHETVVRDSVVVAHGGTARALMAVRAIAAPDSAAVADVLQGVVYAFAGQTMARYG